MSQQVTADDAVENVDVCVKDINALDMNLVEKDENEIEGQERKHKRPFNSENGDHLVKVKGSDTTTSDVVTTEGSKSIQKSPRSGNCLLDRIVNFDMRRTSVPLGVWDDERHLLYVIQNKGKHVSRMGFHMEGKHWLKPEETAFLVCDGEIDVGVLEEGDSVGQNRIKKIRIIDTGDSYTLVYNALALHGVNLIDYYAYVALKKLRFNVFRTGDWDSSPEEILSQVQPTARIDEGCSSSTVDSRLKLRFDCYSPSSQFSVNRRAVPPFVVATSHPADRVPPIKLLRSLATECNSLGTKLRVAVFDGQSVSFVQIEDFNLPDISAATDPKIST